MIEKEILDYLNSADVGLSATVYMEQPPTKPNIFFLMEKTSESVENQIKRATIVIQSYATSLYSASTMSEEVINAMLNMISEDGISRVSLNSNSNFTDATAKQYRYQTTFVVTFY